MRGELLIGGMMFWSDKDNRNMGRVRASSPQLGFKISSENFLSGFVQKFLMFCLKISNDLSKNFYTFV